MEHTKKIVLLSFLTILLLTLGGCFSFFGDEQVQEGLPSATSSIYETTDFSITVPTDWEVIDQNDFTSDVPGETVVVFRNNIKNETFTANVNIVKRRLDTPTDSLEYANLVNNRQKSGLVDYSEKNKDQINIYVSDIETPTYYVVFEARKATDQKLVRYFQTYGVKGNEAYIVTGAASQGENDSTIQTIQNIVKSIHLK